MAQNKYENIHGKRHDAIMTIFMTTFTYTQTISLMSWNYARYCLIIFFYSWSLNAFAIHVWVKSKQLNTQLHQTIGCMLYSYARLLSAVVWMHTFYDCFCSYPKLFIALPILVFFKPLPHHYHKQTLRVETTPAFLTWQTVLTWQTGSRIPGFNIVFLQLHWARLVFCALLHVTWDFHHISQLADYAVVLDCELIATFLGV